MIVFGASARSKTSKKRAGRGGEICQAHHGLCWCVLWRKRKTAIHSRQGKSNNGKLYYEILLPSLAEDCSHFCHLVSFSSRMEHLLKWPSWLKTGMAPTAVTSSEKMNGHRTYRTLILLITMLHATRRFNLTQIPSTS